MATILVVDDRPTNREFLTTLLGYKGHQLLEAADGLEALEMARANPPDLVITDILMPTMDGYEFVRQLRANPNFTQIPVIFHSAHYLEREARALAHSCNVLHILHKPCEPEEVLRAVDAALGFIPPPIAPPAPEEFDHEHLRVLTDKLSQKVDELKMVNLRLTALMEVCQQAASERDALRSLEAFCRAARQVIGAKYAAIVVLGEDGQTLRHFITSGMDAETAARIVAPPVGRGLLSLPLAERRSFRLRDMQADPQAAGFPPHHPPMQSLLGAAIATPTRTYGLLYLTDKLGAEEFSEEDEQLAAALASRVAVTYENTRLYDELQRRAVELEQEVRERQQAEEQVRQLNAELEQRVIERTAQLSSLNQELETFSHSISHDLRAPLRGIDGFTQALFEDYADKLDAEGQNYLQHIRDSAYHLRQLMDALLSLSRVTRRELRCEEVSLSALAQSIARELQGHTPERRVEFQIMPGLSAEGDPRLLWVMLENLLSNAWKFTSKSPQARIEFGAQPQPDGSQVYFVRDNGAGFSMDYAHKLFSPFQRLHSIDEFPGTGIGLATVMRILSRHGGRVWAEGKVEQGATFYFTLAASASFEERAAGQT